jgi:hypothetical protein
MGGVKLAKTVKNQPPDQRLGEEDHVGKTRINR